MVKVTYSSVIDKLYKKLSKLYVKEVQWEGSEHIEISSNCSCDIVFNNTETMKQIMIECKGNKIEIFITDYYNQKLLLKYQVTEAIKIKEWTNLFNGYRQLLEDNKELKKVDEVEKVIAKFFN